MNYDQEGVRGKGERGKGKGERGKGYKPLNSIYVKKEKFLPRLLATRYKASIITSPFLRYGVYVSLFPFPFNLFPAEGL